MDDDELVNEFLVESHESLDQLDQDLVTLEADPTNPEVLSRVFRTIHTIKGTCGFLGFTKLEWVTHVGENLLSRMRDGELLLSADITTALLSLVDAVREILAHIESDGEEGTADYDPLISTLNRLVELPAQDSDAAVTAPTAVNGAMMDTDQEGEARMTVAMNAPDLSFDVSGSLQVGGASDENAASDESSSSNQESSSDEGSLSKVSSLPGEEPFGDENSLSADNLSSEESGSASDDALEPIDLSGLTQVGRIDQHVEQFLMESYEHTDQLDQDLVSLESDPTNQELITQIIGTLHTIKSSSGYLGFGGTEAAAHAGESLLAGLRDGTCQMSPEITTTMLFLVDTLRQALVAIETCGEEQELDFAPLMKSLTTLADPASNPNRAESQWAPPTTVSPDSLTVVASGTHAVPDESASAPPTPAPAAAKETKSPAKASDQSSNSQTQSIADTSIRVDVKLLDRLMDQVGELVLARNRILQLANHQADRSVIAAYQRLDGITSELQEGVMKTRMQPIGTIWNKFPRVVRDLARECGKRVELNMVGEETELDKTLIEAIRDPLTHLVRNAVDHGIEPPEDRRRLGKPESGILLLRAFHEGGQVNIEISDDGGGIDSQRILQLALERKLISAGDAAKLGEKEILHLIFTPGFSTAKNITNVSGRGVGMDVVKNNIEKIKGTIEIDSHVGVGSTIRIRIPLTLAIIPALIIRCDGDRFAIPQASLIELVRLEGEELNTRIEIIQGAAVYRLRGNLLPLVDLREEFGFGAPQESSNSDEQIVNIVVLQADQHQFGLIVEQILDTEEIVVKPLGKQLKSLSVFAGATIMGDGDVALILDVLGLAEKAHVVSERQEALPTDTSVSSEGQQDSAEKLLLFENSDLQRMAIPLSRVTRLEKFPRSYIERSGQFEVVQYWGQVMPLIDVSQSLAEHPAAREQPSPDDSSTRDVVVLTVNSRFVGLVVERILDTVEERLQIDPLRSRAGVIGTIVVQGQVTEMLDVDEIIQQAKPGILAQLATALTES